MADSAPAVWVIVVARLPAQPSRHRVAVWRELRGAGAMPLGGGTWALPTGPMTDEAIATIRDLVARAEDGELSVLLAHPHDDATGAQLEHAYTAAREDEWTEFLGDCDKYLAEVKHEIAKGKFTLAELEEEEQSLERLRRWHRSIDLRDRYGAPSAAAAATRLATCTKELEDYAEQVYEHLGQR